MTTSLLDVGPAHPSAHRSGLISRVTGALVEVTHSAGAAMFDVVALGRSELPGEVVAIRDGVLTVQAYEYTGGLRPGDPVRVTVPGLAQPIAGTIREIGTVATPASQGPAAPVASWPRIGPGRFWADAIAAAVKMQDGAAPGSNGVDAHHGRPQAYSGHLGVELTFVGAGIV